MYYINLHCVFKMRFLIKLISPLVSEYYNYHGVEIARQKDCKTERYTCTVGDLE